MNFEIKPSFERIYKKLPHSEKIQIDDKIKELFAYYNKDVVFAGLRVRKISGKDNYFEINTSSNRRILIRKQTNLIEFIAYGNHDEIKRFLKSFN
jgi:mRNA-degrading endonuclease RelE of RelBE toxin-antitoxin system